MTLSPLLPLPLLLTLSIGVAVLAVFLILRNSRRFSPAARAGLCLLYLIGLGGILALFLNPGSTENIDLKSKPLWIVALDTSESMTAPAGDAPESPTRREEAVRALQALQRFIPEETDIQWLSLDANEHERKDLAELTKLPAVGTESRLSQSLENALRTARSQGKQVNGVLLLSDGRDTAPLYLPGLLQTASTLGIPIHTLPFGGAWEAPDLSLEGTRSLINAFPGNPVLIGAKVINNMAQGVQTAVTLRNQKGEEVGKKVVEIPARGESAVSFPLTCPAESDEYTMTCDTVPGEKRSDNNAQSFSLRVMKSKIRVFMAEGAPYWDSKFLAQLLRKQAAFNVKSVHRLTNDRYYQINTGEDNNAPMPEAGIPTTMEDFLAFDIILLGKSAEHFLTPARAAALQTFIRDHGGLLVFMRGKSYAGKSESLEALEPFVWKSPMSGEHQLRPSPEGVHDGLFGQALPGIDSEIWRSLPGLEDVWDIDRVQPDTRILARTQDKKTPLLAVRRLGMGAVAMINGDGLWKWDFYPEARRLGNCYEDFWSQFLPWIQTASEFAPGYDLSLHAERATVEENAAITCALSWRGTTPPGEIYVELVPIKEPQTVVARADAVFDGEKAGLPRWRAELSAPTPGHYLLKSGRKGDKDSKGSIASSLPEVRIHVLSPPAEQDNLNADPVWLASLSELTGGKSLRPAEYDKVLPLLLKPQEEAVSTEEIFHPLWNRWWLLIGLCLPLALFWHIRRRQGLL